MSSKTDKKEKPHKLLISGKKQRISLPYADIKRIIRDILY